MNEGRLGDHRLGARARQLDLHLGQHPARPAREHHDAIRHVHGLVNVVRHVDDGLARALPDRQQLLLHQLARLRIERGKRLVHQEHGRLDGQCAGDADPLPHPTRQLVRVLRLEAGEPGHVQLVSRATRALRRGDAHLLEPELHVGLHRAPRKQRELLEDHGGGGAARRQLAVEPDRALARRQQSRDEIQQRRLAAARRPEHRDELLGVDDEIDAVERTQGVAGAVGVDLRHALDDDAHASAASAGSAGLFPSPSSAARRRTRRSPARGGRRHGGRRTRSAWPRDPATPSSRP